MATVGFLVGPLVLVAGPGPGRLEKTFDTTQEPRVSVNNMRGQVVVKGWERLQIRAVCNTLSPRVEVDAEATPKSGAVERLELSTHVLDPQVTGNDETVDCTLDIPSASSLEVRNREGSVRVEKLQGDAWIESVSGTITLADVAGHQAVRSVGGDIELVRPTGRVVASSITGSLRFFSPSSSRIHATTNSGQITFDGDFVSNGNYILSTYNGNMDIVCPASASFELKAQTVKGKVDNALPLTTPRRRSAPSFGRANSLLGTYHSGNATVELKSFSGTIRIRPRP